MLIAEIHGKILPEAQNHEDYLTSAVFGHLRYLAPSVFWDELFSLAKGMPDKTGQERTIRQTLTEAGAACCRYEVLQTFFWASHQALGEPDLLLVFSGGHTPPLVVLVEAKLWSGKS